MGFNSGFKGLNKELHKAQLLASEQLHCFERAPSKGTFSIFVLCCPVTEIQRSFFGANTHKV